MTLDPFATIGLAGATVVTVAYFANQRGALASDDWRFPFANLVGALMILASFYTAWNLPAALIEVLWAGVSLYGLMRRRTG
jgi:Na+-translocating ferredoxin:NAD+ oxidoreductase RnfD subunit